MRRGFTRGDFLKAGGALAGAGFVGAAANRAYVREAGEERSLAGRRPNVLVINSDDGGRYLGCYGFDTVYSPNIDNLAASGVRFENAFCAAPSCSPSRAALATGRYPHSTGVTGLLGVQGEKEWPLHKDERPVASLLKEQGYKTYIFAKQHVVGGDVRRRLGFDEHRVPGGNASTVAEDVASVLRRASGPDPLYLEVNFVEPHRPFLRDSTYEPDGSRGVSVPGYLPDSEASRKEFAEVQGAVRVLDDAVGVILDVLDEAGLADNTLVVFTADNGLDMPRAKCSLYDPGIGVSLLLRWPNGGIGRGRVVPELVSHVDVLPTLLAAVGIAAPPAVQGRSFLPLLEGRPYNARNAVYAEKTFHTRYDPMRTVRTNKFKLIRNFEAGRLEVTGAAERGEIHQAHPEVAGGARGPVELYDLRADPHEKRNLAGNEAFADVRAVLDARLWTWMEDTADPLLRGPVATPWYKQALSERP